MLHVGVADRCNYRQIDRKGSANISPVRSGFVMAVAVAVARLNCKLNSSSFVDIVGIAVNCY